MYFYIRLNWCYTSLLSLSLFFCNWGICQSFPSVRLSHLDSSLNRYSAADFSSIVNGKQFNSNYSPSIGTPFLNDASWSQGTLVYSSILFENIPLAFDLYNDILLFNYFHIDGGFALVVCQDSVTTFTLQYRQFINSNCFKGSHPSLKGFVELIHSGKFEVYGKYFKVLYKDTEKNSSVYILKKRYFIKINNIIYPIRSNSAIVRLFPKSIQQDIRLVFRKYEFSLVKSEREEIEDVMSVVESFLL